MSQSHFGRVSGVSVISPRSIGIGRPSTSARWPERLSTYMVTGPCRMVEVDPGLLFTWKVRPGIWIVDMSRFSMSTLAVVNFSTRLVPVGVFTS
ncbi:hypothetical protein [Kitasatospora sp. P5_F3]